MRSAHRLASRLAALLFLVVAPLAAPLLSPPVSVLRAASSRARQLSMDAENAEHAAAAARLGAGFSLSPQADGLELSVVGSLAEIPAEQWDACVAASSGAGRPFLGWHYLHALEASGSAVEASGWRPQHVVARRLGRLVGCTPLYLKPHSHGEYVFDHAWASAYAGARSSAASPPAYYPKLQGGVPFTPVTGPRLLATGHTDAERSATRHALARGLVELAKRLQVSSVHVPYAIADDDGAALAAAGFAQRLGLQYHLRCDGCSSFDEFLASLRPSRRRAVRRERRKVAAQGLVVRRLVGAEISRRHMLALHSFYSRTVRSYNGRQYLTRGFFTRLVEPESLLSPKLMLVTAEDETSGAMVAAALHVLGEDCVYGRVWGCGLPTRADSLHFELCYYQAVEAAIELGLPRVEAGAQGLHKLQRGYLPTLCRSYHWLADGGVENAVGKFLREEREQTYAALAMLSSRKSAFAGGAREHLRSQGVELRGGRILVSREPGREPGGEK